MKTKKPVAIVYNWNRFGEFKLNSEIYHEEGLYDEVIIYSISSYNNVEEDYSRIKPDLIISFGVNLNLQSKTLQKRYIYYPNEIDEIILANDIIVQNNFY